MYLPAISIGYAVPSEDFTASVHSVFQSALNLRLDGKDHLLTLVTSREGDLPQGIRIQAPEEFTFGDFRLGDLVICRDGLLHFENDPLTVPLSGARRWECDLSALNFDAARPSVSAAWNFVWEVLNKRQRLVEAEIVAEDLLPASGRTRISRKAGEATCELVDAARQYNLNTSSVNTLIGLGSGLTPSGDDLLVGYLAGLWGTVQHKSERMRFVSHFGKTIISLSSRTNDISRTYLYHAAQGQVSSRLANLAESVCAGKESEHLGAVAEAVFQVGHTSGMEAVTGLLIGLSTWAGPM